jgi:hypothetical protein
MASRRQNQIRAAVAQDVAGRDLPRKEAYEEPTKGLQKAPVRPTLHPARIRIPDTDWRILETIASQEGTTPSALVRKAIKELIRRQGAGLR